MNQYVISGVKVNTNIEIIGLRTSGYSCCSLDLMFVESSEQAPENWHSIERDDLLAARISPDGKRAQVWMPATVLHHDMAAYIRFIVPFAAGLQGKVFLHAASVIHKGKIVAFIGESGVGKSSLMRAANELGILMVSDDLLLCELRDDKVIVTAGDNVDLCQQPLGAVFFLERSGADSGYQTVSLTKQTTLLRLLHHGFGEMSVQAIHRTQFLMYGHICSQSPAFDLALPDGLRFLGSTVRQILNEL